jgi:CheY-like chemotaxis protein
VTRILLIEDNDVLADVVSEFLRDEGYAVTRTADMGEARYLLAAGTWDPCVVDPAGGSYDKLRSEDAASLRTLAAHTPVVVTTGRGWGEECPRGGARRLGDSVETVRPADAGASDRYGACASTDSSKQTEHPSSPDGNGLTVAA